MNKRTLFLIIMLLGAAASACSAGDLPRIAVYVTGAVSGNEKEALGTIMLAALVNSGRYMGVERSESFLAEVEREQTAQRSGAIDDSQISALGKQFGVQHICIAAITPALGSFQVSARIVDVETAQVVFIGEAASPLKTMDDLMRVSDEVVMIMFGEAPARQRGRHKVGVSVGAGGLFSGDFGGGVGREVGMPYKGFGAYLFVDAKYAQIIVSYIMGGGKWESAKDIPGGLPGMRRSFVGVGAYAKYPELALMPSGAVKVFPLIGADYEVCVAGKFTRDGGEEEFDGKDKRPKTDDLSALWGRAGAGSDFNLNKDVHMRVELLYGARMANAYEKSFEGEPRLGHGLTARVGAGIRF